MAQKWPYCNFTMGFWAPPKFWTNLVVISSPCIGNLFTQCLHLQNFHCALRNRLMPFLLANYSCNSISCQPLLWELITWQLVAVQSAVVQAWQCPLSRWFCPMHSWWIVRDLESEPSQFSLALKSLVKILIIFLQIRPITIKAWSLGSRWSWVTGCPRDDRRGSELISEPSDVMRLSDLCLPGMFEVNIQNFSRGACINKPFLFLQDQIQFTIRNQFTIFPDFRH